MCALVGDPNSVYPSLFTSEQLARDLRPKIMYLLTEWEGRTGKSLARGHGVRTERSEVRALRPRAEYFPVRPDLNSPNKHFIIWALYTIH